MDLWAPVAARLAPAVSRVRALWHSLLVWSRRVWAVRGVRPCARVSVIAAVAVLAGGLGMTLGGRVETTVGPADVSFGVRPALSGGTVVDIPPLGTLRFDSHEGPVQLRAQLEGIHPEPARRLIDNPKELDEFTEVVGGEVRHGVIVLAVKSSVLAIGCAGLAGLLLFRSWRRALWTGGTSLVALGSVVVLGIATFNPQSVAEPRFTGILASAPQVVGDARSVVRRFEEYRALLAQLVGNVSRLYAVTSTLPAYEPDPSTVRVLHVADLHLNPASWSIIRSVVRQFQIQVIVDSGDITDHGSKAENKYLDDIGRLGVPYVFVRGNHDSRDTQKAVAKQKNAIVLDGGVREVEGIRFYGVGDPRFTPDKTTRDDDVTAADMTATGKRIASEVYASGARPDVAVIHDPNEGQSFDGVTPLVLAGHSHKRATRLMPAGTRLFVQGSTGSAGLRGLEREEPTPAELSVLYFSRASHRLQAWDNIRLGGLGLASANIERQLEKNPNREIKPPAPPVGTPSPTASPSP